MAKQRLEEIIKIRTERINKLRELGVEPYPPTIKKKKIPISLARDKKGKGVVVVGRLMGWRAHGNIIFADLKDEAGNIQLFFQKKSLGDRFELLKYFDMGDFVWVEGKVFQTKAGEITIDVIDFQLLTKSVRPLPSVWHGLKDVEERYRKRYLDMLMNPSVVDTLRIRSGVVDAIRGFLNRQGYIEVETPTLQPMYGGGFAKPFVTHHNALDSDFYLRISDEMYLKRLIVGGFEKVYEITKVFRNEGVDRDHNPEFTMFEAQIAYEDYTFGMDLIEEIIEYAAMQVLKTTKVDYQGTKIDFKRPWKRLKLVEAVKEHVGIDPLKWDSVIQARKVARGLKISRDKLKEIEKMRTVGEITAFLFEELVEPNLIHPTIIYDYPIEVSPLAKKCEDQRFTQRFEMFAMGSELGNNYSELNDPVDLNKRFVEEKKREETGFKEAHQTDYDYLIAIEHGFPPTSGISIGVDRLVMLFTNAKTIREVIAFPTLRPTLKINVADGIPVKDKPDVGVVKPVNDKKEKGENG